MVELVDTADSKSAAARRGGSIPPLGTRLQCVLRRECVSMMRFLPFLLALVCGVSFAEPASLESLSGAFYLNAPLRLTDGELTPFSATLALKGQPPCQLTGRIWAAPPFTAGSTRELVILAGSTPISCPGLRDEPVFGNFVLNADARGWTPPQSYECETGRPRACGRMMTIVAAKTFGFWQTWQPNSPAN